MDVVLEKQYKVFVKPASGKEKTYVGTIFNEKTLPEYENLNEKYKTTGGGWWYTPLDKGLNCDAWFLGKICIILDELNKGKEPERVTSESVK